MKLALERDYDVDEHEREMTARTIPVVIGKGGATIKRLQQEAAPSSIDRASSTLRISGSGRRRGGRRRRRRPRRLGVEIEIEISPARSG